MSTKRKDIGAATGGLVATTTVAPDSSTGIVFLALAGLIAVQVGLTFGATITKELHTHSTGLRTTIVALAISASLVIGMLTIYTIFVAWRVACNMHKPLFGTIAFVILFIINLLVITVTVLTAVLILSS